MPYATESFPPRTQRSMDDPSARERVETEVGRLRSFVSKHPWLTLATALGAGVALGMQGHHIAGGARRLGSGARDVGAGAWHKMGDTVSRIRR